MNAIAKWKYDAAIAKKEFSIYDVATVKSIETIYNEYFSKNNCQSVLTLLNRFSVVDAVLNSGSTSIVLELKSRKLFVHEYETTILEVEKYESLKKSASLFAAPVFYILDFTDAVLVYQLDFQKEMVPDYIELPISNKSGEKIRKPIYHLPVLDADIIIGKRTWQRASREQLNYYINQKKK